MKLEDVRVGMIVMLWDTSTVPPDEWRVMEVRKPLPGGRLPVTIARRTLRGGGMVDIDVQADEIGALDG